MPQSAAFGSIVARTVEQLRQAHANHRYTAKDMMGCFGRAVRGMPRILSPREGFGGADFRRGHTMIAASDAPYEALPVAAKQPDAPDTEKLCGSTGIINVGMFGRRIVVKLKWAVRCKSVRPCAHPI